MTAESDGNPELLRLREKAARFYFKELTGWLSDWIEGISPEDDPHVDADVRDLYKLLVETRREGERAVLSAAEAFASVTIIQARLAEASRLAEALSNVDANPAIAVNLAGQHDVL